MVIIVAKCGGLESSVAIVGNSCGLHNHNCVIMVQLCHVVIVVADIVSCKQGSKQTPVGQGRKKIS
jgi:hypothetical protein